LKTRCVTHLKAERMIVVSGLFNDPALGTPELRAISGKSPIVVEPDSFNDSTLHP
jgi:hypothetical protein